jgi:hypothetical protein
MTEDIDYDRPLMRWLDGKRFYLKSPTFIAFEDYKLDSVDVLILHRLPIHMASTAQLRQFDATWEDTLKYLDSACSILRKPRPGWAPSAEQAQLVLDKLGPPPLRCYALYFVTVGDGESERCVYIGETNSKTHRFKSGHHALPKLFHPKFDGLRKSIYFAGIEVHDDDDHYFPIEWIHPVQWRQEVLSSVEGQLIFELQPELNSKNKRSSKPKHNLPITVFNDASDFMNFDRYGPEQSAREIEDDESL